MSEQDIPTFGVKRIKFYHIYLLIKYLSIRYQVFVEEDKRPFIGEFSARDIIANHFIFIVDNQEVGTARIIYKDNIAELGRVALLKEYRKQGYGRQLVKQVINYIQNDNKVKFISLITESKNVVFYKKIGFKENAEVFLDNMPYINMIISFES